MYKLGGDSVHGNKGELNTEERFGKGGPRTREKGTIKRGSNGFLLGPLATNNKEGRVYQGWKRDVPFWREDPMRKKK